MSTSKPGGSTLPGPEQVPPVAETLGSDAVARAQRNMSCSAIRAGATEDELREVLRALGISVPGPTGGRYTPDGRRVRPHAMPKGTRGGDGGNR